jgi:hypothetical protein
LTDHADATGRSWSIRPSRTALARSSCADMGAFLPSH